MNTDHGIRKYLWSSVSSVLSMISFRRRRLTAALQLQLPPPAAILMKLLLFFIHYSLFTIQYSAAAVPAAEQRVTKGRASVTAQGKLSAAEGSQGKLYKPNIVVILTDDHRADYLGCAGHPIIKTPHIDQLAADGTYFKNAFVTTAACTPNRTSILTGQYERKHGITFGSAGTLTEEAFRDTYPVILRKAGYFTGYVGKNHTPIGWTDTLRAGQECISQETA